MKFSYIAFFYSLKSYTDSVLRLVKSLQLHYAKISCCRHIKSKLAELMLPFLIAFHLGWIDSHHWWFDFCLSTDNLPDSYFNSCYTGYTRSNEFRHCGGVEKWSLASNFDDSIRSQCTLSLPPENNYRMFY